MQEHDVWQHSQNIVAVAHDDTREAKLDEAR